MATKYYTPINPELDHTNANYYRIIYFNQRKNHFWSGLWNPVNRELDEIVKHLSHTWELNNYWDVEFSLTGHEKNI